MLLQIAGQSHAAHNAASLIYHRRHIHLPAHQTVKMGHVQRKQIVHQDMNGFLVLKAIPARSAKGTVKIATTMDAVLSMVEAPVDPIVIVVGISPSVDMVGAFRAVIVAIRQAPNVLIDTASNTFAKMIYASDVQIPIYLVDDSLLFS